MDGFGRLLFDACRQREELVSRKGSLSELSYAAETIAQIYAKISEHRGACVICQIVDYRLRNGHPLGKKQVACRSEEIVSRLF